jgi:two-component system OmpR family response regulator
VAQSYRALAVEDDADSLQLMRLVLKDLPLQIDHAPTGSAAIDYLSRLVPDIMFLDINLPDMRGWDVLDRFRSDPRLGRLQVIVLTSHHEPVHRLIGMLQPIAAYLRKPVDAEILRQHVRQYLGL